MTAYGPFETEAEARAAAHKIIPPEPGWSILSEDQHRELLEQICAESGVELGAFERRILGWLANWEDATCTAIAAIITRAHEAGKRSGRDDTPTERLGS